MQPPLSEIPGQSEFHRIRSTGIDATSQQVGSLAVESEGIVQQGNPEHDTGDATYHFVYCRHSPENAGAVANAVRGSNIVAIEWTGITADERARYEAELNQLAHTADSAEREQLIGEFSQSHMPEFVARVAAELTEEPPTFYLIDFGPEDGELTALSEQEDMLDDRYERELGQGKSTVDLTATLMERIAATGALDKGREALVASQLHAISASAATLSPKIAVVQGAAHTGTQHTLRRAGAQTSRSIIAPATTGDSRSRMHFWYLDQATREIALGITETPNELLAKRAILYDFYSRSDILVPDDIRSGARQISYDEVVTERAKAIDTLRRQVIDKMQESDIDALFANIDTIRSRTFTPDPWGATPDTRWADTLNVLAQNAQHFMHNT